MTAITHTMQDRNPPCWEDLRVAMSSTRSAAGAPGFALFKQNGASTGVFINWFDKTSEESLYFEVQMPHSWLEGSDVKAHVHWVPASNGASGSKVSWGLEYTWANIGSTFGNTTIIYGNAHVPADAVPVAGRHYLTPLGTIDATGKTLSSMLCCRIFRNATGAGGSTDDYDYDAGLLEFDLHFLVEGRGSVLETTKG